MNWHQKHIDGRTPGDTIADKMASFIGSWKFIIIQSAVFVIWVILNTLWLFHSIVWDAYPFILFNLFMSAEAAYASPLLLMSQNRQAERDRVHAEADYKTNVEAKIEIEELQTSIARIEIEKLDQIIKRLDDLNNKS